MYKILFWVTSLLLSIPSVCLASLDMPDVGTLINELNTAGGAVLALVVVAVTIGYVIKIFKKGDGFVGDDLDRDEADEKWNHRND